MASQSPAWKVTVNFYVRAKTREDAWRAAQLFAARPSTQNTHAIEVERVSLEPADAGTLTINDVVS